MITGLFILLISTLSCSKDLEEIVTNVDPTCQITFPENAVLVFRGDTVTITAVASDTDGSIKKVRFFIDNVLMHSDNSAPYAYTWYTDTVAPGQHTITADSDDGISFSTISEVNVLIVEK